MGSFKASAKHGTRVFAFSAKSRDATCPHHQLGTREVHRRQDRYLTTPKSTSECQITHEALPDGDYPALMTRNNLQEHLAWLLSTKPFVPPHVQIPSQAQNSPLSSATLSTGTPAVDSAILPNNAQRAPAVSTQFSILEPQSRAPLPQIAFYDSYTRKSPDRDMARLRSEPNSAAKPRLVLQTLQSQIKTPASASRSGGVDQRRGMASVLVV